MNKQYPFKVDEATRMTTPEYWDCECEDNYIHSCKEAFCQECGAIREDMPDSRPEEVEAWITKRLGEEAHAEKARYELSMATQPKTCAWCHFTVDEATGLPVRKLSNEEYSQIVSHGICKPCTDDLMKGV